ncbi:cob(I)yrinic acid a,c-diamide adenosyltransferase [Candidatus Acetothermia bacterium]|nr:cob(I)yrinic acid a,c-diamide adenosyltransferase [Candidatus Acetothermia bacterium]
MISVRKDNPRVSAYGSVDEANAALGVALAELQEAELAGVLQSLQHTLFYVGTDLATPPSSRYRANIVPLTEGDVATLELLINRFETELPPLKQFILPGGHPAAAALQLARAVVRRAEREVVALAQREEVNHHVRIYLNRLSDLLFVLARVVNHRTGSGETPWRRRNTA